MRNLLLCLLAIHQASGWSFPSEKKLQKVADQFAKKFLKLDAFFSKFRNRFKRQYASEEEMEYRKRVFEQNLDEVEKNPKSGAFEEGINEFSDLTWQEFSESYLMKNVEEEKIPEEEKKAAQAQKESFPFTKGRRLQSELSDLPRKFSWKSFATPVKDQKKCAACYAFAATGAMEIVLNRQRESQISLSEQEVIDCSTENNGCVGGNPVLVYQYARVNGLSESARYPFIQAQSNCSKRQTSRLGRNVRYSRVGPSELELIKALRKGPISILHVASKKLKSYVGGVFDDPDCVGKLNHAAVIVGYDLDAPVPYFELRNAWGPKYGENGYYKLAIKNLEEDGPGVCRMTDHMSIVVVENA